MNDGRKPFLIASFLLVLIAVAVESSSKLWLGGAAAEGVGLGDTPLPGWGLPALAVLDGLLLLMLAYATLTAMGISAGLVGRVQGIATIVLSFFAALGGLLMLILTFALLILMVSLLLAVPFGTIAYAAAFGHFDRSGAAITLGAVMLLKLGAALLLVLHSMQTLKSKMVVALLACSILLTLLLAFLHGLVPGLLVSITDAIGAIIALIVGIIWAVIFLVSGIISVFRVLQESRSHGKTVTAR
jgi:hypothetical protein